MAGVAAWRSVIGDNVVELTKIFRQSEDLEFMRILQMLRKSSITPELLHNLNRLGQAEVDDVIRLYPTNVLVRDYNMKRLNELESEFVKFNSYDWYEKYGKLDEPLSQEQIKNLISAFDSCLIEREIELKLGCKVMLLFNKDTSKGLVNGSQGILKKWEEASKFESDINEASTMGSLWLKKHKKIPIVEFEGLDVPILPVQLQTELSYGASFRFQIPLKAAYALTVHKCQGMTLKYAAIDMKKSFTDGQVYVALSRVQALSGLRLLSPLQPTRITANADALKFYRLLRAKQRKAELLEKRKTNGESGQ